MSNKTDATWHGPPSDPWPADTLPQREPFMTLADYDGSRMAAARLAREAPPWVTARRAADAYDPRWHQVLIGVAGDPAPPPPPPPPPAPEPPRIPPSWPAWVTPVVAGAVGALAFLAALAAIAALGLL